MTNRLIALLILISFSSSASAYIDPASGSAIMSAVVGFFVAIGLAVKTYWYKIKGIFSKKSAAPLETPQETRTETRTETAVEDAQDSAANNNEAKSGGG